MKLSFNLERKLRRFTIHNLMNYVVGAMALIFVIDLVMPTVNLYGMLSLRRDLVLQGQVWRLLTFALLPPDTSLLWIIFSLYFYWMIGTTLENQWGSFKFNLFYWVGILGNILSAFITGYADNTFLNLSLFFAFAALMPDYQVMVFFILPVKVKYLALLDLALYTYSFIVGGFSVRMMIVFSLLNIILFLGGDIVNYVRRDSKYWKTRRNFRKAMRK